MSPLSKYLWGLAAAASLFFSGYEGVSNWMPANLGPNAETPQWKTERLARDPATPVLPAASLSPIYPASPGKELLGKEIIIAARAQQKHRNTSVGNLANNHAKIALAANKLPRDLLKLSGTDKYSQQRMGYAMEPQTPIERASFEHGLY